MNEAACKKWIPRQISLATVITNEILLVGYTLHHFSLNLFFTAAEIQVKTDLAGSSATPLTGSHVIELNVQPSHQVAFVVKGARCSSVVRAFAHGAMGRQIDPSWGGPIELFLVPASAPRLV